MGSCSLQLATIFAVLLLVLRSNSSPLDFPEGLLIDDFAKLPLDSNGRLADNWFLYQDTPDCKAAFASMWSRELPALRLVSACSPSITETFFGSASPLCSAVSLSRGMAPDLFRHALPNDMLIVTVAREMQELVTVFVAEHQEVEAGWTSHFKGKLTIYWVHPETGERYTSGTLEYGEQKTVWLRSVIGHKFEVVDDATNSIIETHIVKCHSFFVVGLMEMNSEVRDITAQVESTFNQEWQRSRNVKRTFTELGFTLGKLPPDLWGSMSSYYYNNRNSKFREEWGAKGIFVNWWETDVFMIAMPLRLKKYWQARLMTLVEAWSGVELELTDIYGMRRYEEGARLLTHVDREATHAASLIINVAQGGVREPWAVEIYDFADRLHEITMQEGDIVYYESARCLHGRMKPLQGAFYVNLFAHYRPVGDPDWFRKENPADGVPHLIDIGDCQVSGGSPNCTNSKGRVPFLSPTLEKLSGPQDLLRYWKQTAPAARKAGGDEL